MTKQNTLVTTKTILEKLDILRDIIYIYNTKLLIVTKFAIYEFEYSWICKLFSSKTQAFSLRSENSKTL